MDLHDVKLTELIATVYTVASERPDYTYKGDVCSYVPTELDPCGCLFGAALAKLGVPVGRLARLDHASITGDAVSIRQIIEKDWITDDTGNWQARDRAIEWCAHVQEVQDRYVYDHETHDTADYRFTWSSAVQSADRCYPKVRQP